MQELLPKATALFLCIFLRIMTEKPAGGPGTKGNETGAAAHFSENRTKFKENVKKTLAF